jgi:hypothetical protein
MKENSDVMCTLHSTQAPHRMLKPVITMINPDICRVLVHEKAAHARVSEHITSVHCHTQYPFVLCQDWQLDCYVYVSLTAAALQ